MSVMNMLIRIVIAIALIAMALLLTGEAIWIPVGLGILIVVLEMRNYEEGVAHGVYVIATMSEADLITLRAAILEAEEQLK